MVRTAHHASLLFRGLAQITDWELVDICITTDWREMESVCRIAELLASRTFLSDVALFRLHPESGC